ncbi:hypothetical protein [Brevundimonas vesicularis]|uniref:hypothetical protein n=1 Tax=Brevundimonas vesicularis TaxID=41276 RepID=UPI0038516580
MGVGLYAWTSDPLATVEQADAYALARGWTDWLALTEERRSSALLDASTYIKATYSAPYPVTASMELAIQSAAIEAARLSLTSPLIGGDVDPAIKSVKAGSAAVEFEASAKARSSRLALVAALLRSVGIQGGSTINVPLRKA